MYSLPSGPSFNSVSLPLSSLYLYPNVSEPPTFPFASNVAVCSGALVSVGVTGVGCAGSGALTVTSIVVPFNVRVSPNLTLVSPPFPSFIVIYCLAT